MITRRFMLPIFAVGMICCFAGCVGPSSAGRATLSAKVMSEYLAKNELDTPYIRAAATSAVNRGEPFRERVRDQRARWVLLTIWMDPGERNLLHIKTKRDITCPRCHGSGVRGNTGKIPDIGVSIRCPECKGSGIVEGHIEEKRYIIENGSSSRGGLFRSSPRQEATSTLPAPAPEEEVVSPMVQQRFDDLLSKEARVRVQALEWLAHNYLRKETFFQRYMPFLRKARWIETDKVSQLTVYQFHAGLDAIPEYAYFRVYVDVKSGTVETFGFYAKDDASTNKKPRESIFKKAKGFFKN